MKGFIKISTLTVGVTAFIIAFAWVFSGWPQIVIEDRGTVTPEGDYKTYTFPPEAEKVHAATSSLPTLIPGAGTTPNGGDAADSTEVENEVGSTCDTVAHCADSIDETIANSSSADFNINTIKTQGSIAQGYELTDMPADFSSMSTSTPFTVAVDVTTVGTPATGNGADVVELVVSVVQDGAGATLAGDGAGGTVTICTFTDGTNTCTGITTTTLTLEGNNNKTAWDSAELQFTWNYTKSQGWDDIQIQINSGELNGSYNQSGNTPPTVSNVELNNGNTITVVENTTTSISAAASTTDPEGASDLASATGTIFRSGVGGDCTADDNNCYRIDSSGCSFDAASTTVICTADIWFHADPTDASSTNFSAEDWQASITATDVAGATDSSSTASGVELNTLWAIDTLSGVPIEYGFLQPNSTSTNRTTTIKNAGNAALDIELSGEDLTGTGGTILVDRQKYATSSIDNWDTCTDCTQLLSGEQTLELDLAKPTSSSTAVTDDVFWMLSVPNGTASSSYTGQNTFTATGD